MDTALGHQIVGDALGTVDRNGEADAGGGAAGRENRRVDADDLAARVDERTAGIAAINGGVGLNGFIDESALAGLHGPAERADYSGGQGALETEGISDGQNFLTDLQCGGITQWQGDEMLSL